MSMDDAYTYVTKNNRWQSYGGTLCLKQNVHTGVCRVCLIRNDKLEVWGRGKKWDDAIDMAMRRVDPLVVEDL